MIISRLKQGLRYIFLRYDIKKDSEIREILSDYEFELFSKMSNYDKLHSYTLMKKVRENKVLSQNIVYLKLALLHDCAKGNASLLRRIKKVLVGDKFLDMHGELAYELLKDHDLDLAYLCKIHHSLSDDICMKEFQNLDNI